MIKNKFYEAPEAELLEVKFEEGFLTNSPGVSGGAGSDDPIVDDETDLD